jgi:hypothetical protein
VPSCDEWLLRLLVASGPSADSTNAKVIKTAIAYLDLHMAGLDGRKALAEEVGRTHMTQSFEGQ